MTCLDRPKDAPQGGHVARIAPVIAQGHPHHVTRCGNRRQRTFFGGVDYDAYLEFIAEWCRRCAAAVWGYCLMPNHEHLRRHARTGRPLGDIEFLLRLEGLLDREVLPPGLERDDESQADAALHREHSACSLMAAAARRQP